MICHCHLETHRATFAGILVSIQPVLYRLKTSDPGSRTFPACCRLKHNEAMWYFRTLPSYTYLYLHLHMSFLNVSLIPKEVGAKICTPCVPALLPCSTQSCAGELIVIKENTRLRLQKPPGPKLMSVLFFGQSIKPS